MNDDMSEMLAHFRIRQVLERYCRGIDRLDAALISSVYWDDATDNHGVYIGPAVDFADFVVPKLAEAYDQTMHMIGQSCIEVKSRLATADTYFISYHVRKNDDGTFVDVGGGRYVDIFEQRNDEWRIKERTVIMEWVETRSGLDKAAFDIDQFTRGKRDRSDLSYRPLI